MGKHKRGKKKKNAWKIKGTKANRKSEKEEVEAEVFELEDNGTEQKSFDVKDVPGATLVHQECVKMDCISACKSEKDLVSCTNQEFAALKHGQSEKVGTANEFSEKDMKNMDDSMASGTRQNDEEMKNAVKETPLAATVFVAAPLVKNRNLAIIGEDEMLGKWKQPQGHFQPNKNIYQDIWIFKGIVPVPIKPGSAFKFVHVDSKGSIDYEGCGQSDNRAEELIPDSWNFFVHRDIMKSTGFWNFATGFWNTVSSSQSRKMIATEFFRISLQHIIENVIPDWDSAFELVNDIFKKIRRAIGEFTSESFREFITDQLQQKDLNFDFLLLLVIGASQMDIYSKKLKETIEQRSRDFSLYLHRFKKFKRRHEDFKGIMKLLALHGGHNFWWIFFRMNHRVENLWDINPKELSESVLKTMIEIPEVLLTEPETASRVVNYLVHWIDIDEFYARICPIFGRNSNYQPLLETLLLKTLITNKMDIDGLSNILRSDFMKKMFEDCWCSPNESGNRFQENKADLFYRSIGIIFDQTKLKDVIMLAFQTPQYFLPIVRPVVEEFVAEKLEKQPNWNVTDYHFFANLEDNRLNNFFQAKQQIQCKLENVTRGHAKSGSFQAIPSVKLCLFALSERDTPFLERPSIVDLHNALSSLPRKFFQNLYSALKKEGSSLNKILEPYRNGQMKEVVERVTNHFLQLEEILDKAKKLYIPLVELVCLQVCLKIR